MNLLPKTATALLATFCLGLVPTNRASAQPLPPTQEQVCPLLVNSKAPTAQRLTAQKESFDLSTLIGKKPTIVVFYRGDW